jgi:glucose dehydrogenase
MTEQELIAALEKATSGLLWYSESEYPLEVIYCQNIDNLTYTNFLQNSNHPTETKIVTTEFDNFFATVTKEQEWHNETEKAETKRYQNLVNLLSNNLHNLQVYLIGEIEIDVYILGKTTNQAIVGLSTKIIAT